MTRTQITRQLVRAARGGRGRCFALHGHHFGRIASGDSQNDAVATPSDFHSHLCEMIRHAQERVILASLYIGVGSRSFRDNHSPNNHCKEDVFLQSLRHAASNPKLKQMQIILDANRAMRKVSLTSKHNAVQSHGSEKGNVIYTTNSADTVISTLKPFIDRQRANAQSESKNSGLFLFPVYNQRLCAILPSPLDEVAGVFHIKAYVVDDELILSGANLSEEYFSTRLDRYMLFTAGGGGLVDFYAELCDTLCSYAVKFDGRSSLLSTQDSISTRKQQLESSLTRLMVEETQTILPDSSPVAYAIPTLQLPSSFPEMPFQFQSDTDATANLLSTAVESGQNVSVRLSSAYLNLTTRLSSILTMFGNKRGGAPYVLTAGAISHGFAPKENQISKQNAGIIDRIKSSIPKAFLTLVNEAAQSIIACGGKVLLYERPGWTFHAKGVWITVNDAKTTRRELIDDPASVVSTIIGSGNYGSRSEDLDVESNCIIVFNGSNESISTQQSVANEWNEMCLYGTEPTNTIVGDNGSMITKIVVQVMKKFF